ncbi:MAG: ATP synthase F1 subunit epsilon [Proteobacteria bacterium]|nr:ATP synthase F1 subunit epsilon [Pseudomonadota bacterium]
MAVQPPGKTTFELVSPERLLLSQPVDMVVVPGSEGLFAALIGHAPFIATLKPGVIDVWDDGRITERIFVGGGFAEVTQERCVVLAETAAPVGELDRAKVVERIEELKNVADLARSTGGGAAGGILAELELNQAMLAALDQKAA